MLQKIEQKIRQRAPLLKITVVEDSGIIRLPASILFEKSKADLRRGEGESAVAVVAQVLAEVLPCYTQPRPASGCKPDNHSIDAIFIEGHTDSDPYTGAGDIRDNLDLSAKRATNTYRFMTAAAGSLLNLKNGSGQNVLSVSGYGDSRQLPDSLGDDEISKSRNRRIDLRFLMETPKDSDIANILVKQP